MPDAAPPPAYVTVLPALMQTPPSEAGWVVLERFSGPNGDDFYTASTAEQQSVAGTLRYTDRGRAGYVYQGPDGQVPLYRYYDAETGLHYYTADTDAPQSPWHLEGTAGYLAHGGVTEPGVSAITTSVTIYVISPAAPAPAVGTAPVPRVSGLVATRQLRAGHGQARWRGRTSRNLPGLSKPVQAAAAWSGDRAG